MLITTRPARYLDNRLVGPVVAFTSSGFRQAEADAIEVADCQAVRITYRSANCSTEAGCSLLAATTVLCLFMNERELPFVPFGKDHRFAQDAARLIGFSELSATLQLRLRQWKYTVPPAGALVPDVTSALPFVERVLRDVEEGVTDVSLFRQRWAIRQMKDWQAQGVDYPDALGAPNFLN